MVHQDPQILLPGGATSNCLPELYRLLIQESFPVHQHDTNAAVELDVLAVNLQWARNGRFLAFREPPESFTGNRIEGPS